MYIPTRYIPTRNPGTAGIDGGTEVVESWGGLTVSSEDFI